MSKDKPPTPFLILRDSAEPCPENDPEEAWFRPSIRHRGELFDVFTLRANMSEGDYSLPGLCVYKEMGATGEWSGEPVVAIERKSLSDAIGTIVGTTTTALGEAASNRDRFAAELERLRRYAFKCIVVEANLPDVFRAADGRRFNPESVVQSYMAFAPRFGVQVWWAGSRMGAEWYVGSTLARIWEEHTGGAAYKRAKERGDLPHLPWARDVATPQALEAITLARMMAEKANKETELSCPNCGSVTVAPCPDDVKAAMGSDTFCRDCSHVFDSKPKLAPAGGMTASTAEYQRAQEAKRMK